MASPGPNELTRHCPLGENPPVIGGFPSQKASNAENISIYRRHCEEEYNLNNRVW